MNKRANVARDTVKSWSKGIEVIKIIPNVFSEKEYARQLVDGFVSKDLLALMIVEQISYQPGVTTQGCSKLADPNVFKEIVDIHTVLKKGLTDISDVVAAKNIEGKAT